MLEMMEKIKVENLKEHKKSINLKKLKSRKSNGFLNKFLLFFTKLKPYLKYKERKHFN